MAWVRGANGSCRATIIVGGSVIYSGLSSVHRRRYQRAHDMYGKEAKKTLVSNAAWTGPVSGSMKQFLIRTMFEF